MVTSANKTSEIATKTTQVDLTSPNDIMAFATNLKELIVQNKLYTNIKSKNYVNVEGWQIAGAFTGIFPIVEKVENLSDGKDYKYRAEVTLRDKNNNIVGSGMAICTNEESGKKNFDEYAVASMAQTRAVGKAFRMKIGWLLKIAGYETTPAEEMDAVVYEAEDKDEGKKPKINKPSQKPSLREISYAKDNLSQAKRLEELVVLFSTLSPALKREQEIIDFARELKRDFIEAQDSQEVDYA